MQTIAYSRWLSKVWSYEFGVRSNQVRTGVNQETIVVKPKLYTLQIVSGAFGGKGDRQENGVGPPCHDWKG